MGYCTKCLVRPMVKNHMCEACAEDHEAWLKQPIKRASKSTATDDDGFYTIYESGGRQNGS